MKRTLIELTSKLLLVLGAPLHAVTYGSGCKEAFLRRFSVWGRTLATFLLPKMLILREAKAAGFCKGI